MAYQLRKCLGNLAGALIEQSGIWIARSTDRDPARGNYCRSLMVLWAPTSGWLFGWRYEEEGAASACKSALCGAQAPIESPVVVSSSNRLLSQMPPTCPELLNRLAIPIISVVTGFLHCNGCRPDLSVIPCDLPFAMRGMLSAAGLRRGSPSVRCSRRISLGLEFARLHPGGQ